jgi:AraC family transcriptional regulator, dual regulator of chb operon
MDYKELESYLRELDSEEKILKLLMDEKENQKLENEVIKIYSTDTSNKEWTINCEKLMKEDENFAIHKHKRFTKFKEHKHDYLELIYVFSGSINQKINGVEVNINKGEICLLDLNLFHSIEPAFENDIAVNIIMKKEFFDGIFMSFLSDNDIISDFIIKTFYHKKEHKNYLLFHTNENEMIQTIMNNILCEYFEGKIGSDTAIHAYILLLFTELLRYYRENMGQSNIKSLNRTIISEVKSYLSRNYKSVTLKETADYFHFHPDYLSKLIKNSTGVSFTDLLQEIKLKEASLLIENTDLPILDITYEVGYNNLSYFYKIFRKKYSVTPTEFRKNFLDKHKG